MKDAGERRIITKQYEDEIVEKFITSNKQLIARIDNLLYWASKNGVYSTIIDPRTYFVRYLQVYLERKGYRTQYIDNKKLLISWVE